MSPDADWQQGQQPSTPTRQLFSPGYRTDQQSPDGARPRGRGVQTGSADNERPTGGRVWGLSLFRKRWGITVTEEMGEEIGHIVTEEMGEFVTCIITSSLPRYPSPIQVSPFPRLLRHCRA